jgi:hypothetical protein
MADVKISGLPSATLPLAGTEVLPIVQSSTTKKVASDDLTVKNVRSNATTGLLQITGPAASSTRIMTTPNANFTVARIDNSQTFTGAQTFNDTVTATKFIPTGNNVTGNGMYLPATNTLAFSTNGSESMRIVTGDVRIGTTSAVAGGLFSLNRGTAGVVVGLRTAVDSGTETMIGFLDGDSVTCGAINIDATANTTSYGTSSDYRLKENIAPITSALEKLAELKPCTWNWKHAPEITGQGFIAHELAEVCPEAVVGSKDETEIRQVEVSPAVFATYDDQGNELTPEVQAIYEKRELPKYQTVDTSFLVATLTAAIQELSAKNNALETRILALEKA